MEWCILASSKKNVPRNDGCLPCDEALGIHILHCPLLNPSTRPVLAWFPLTTAWLDSVALPSRGQVPDGSKLANVWQAWATETTPDRLRLSWYFRLKNYLLPKVTAINPMQWPSYTSQHFCRHQIYAVSHDDLSTSYNTHVYRPTITQIYLYPVDPTSSTANWRRPKSNPLITFPRNQWSRLN